MCKSTAREHKRWTCAPHREQHRVLWKCPDAVKCPRTIVLRPTLAGAGDYKELRRIPLPKYNKDSRRVPKGPV